MSEIGEIYAKAVYSNLKPLFANWEPGKPVQLGDYGVIHDRSLVYMGNVANLGLKFAERKDPTPDHKFFASKGSTDVIAHAKGSASAGGIASAKAALEVKFSSENAVFFNAAECRYNMIADKVALGKAIMAKYAAGEWKRNWAIVTDLVKAGSTTVAVSGGSTASVVFEAKTDINQIDTSDASIGLDVKKAHNVGYQVAAIPGLIPLLGFCMIQPRFILWKEFGPVLHKMVMADMLEYEHKLRGEESDKHVLKGEASEELYFGQLL